MKYYTLTFIASLMLASLPSGIFVMNYSTIQEDASQQGAGVIVLCVLSAISIVGAVMLYNIVTKGAL